MRFFTSDLHIGHANIVHLANRPFKNVDHMDAMIADRWNSIVTPDDTVFILGDLALGPIDKSLAKVKALNGHKRLIMGNHDRPFIRRGKADHLAWRQRYIDDADMEEITLHKGLTIGEHWVGMSHFPYVGDSHDGDRFEGDRLVDKGVPLIHGHTHRAERLTRSPKGTVQIHVGMDAWDFSPVSEEQVALMLNMGDTD